MAIVCMVIVSIYVSSVLTSIINFILLHRAGVFTHRGIEATPTKYRLKECEAGEEYEYGAPGGGDGP